MRLERDSTAAEPADLHVLRSRHLHQSAHYAPLRRDRPDHYYYYYHHHNDNDDDGAWTVLSGDVCVRHGRRQEQLQGAARRPQHEHLCVSFLRITPLQNDAGQTLLTLPCRFCLIISIQCSSVKCTMYLYNIHTIWSVFACIFVNFWRMQEYWMLLVSSIRGKFTEACGSASSLLQQPVDPRQRWVSLTLSGRENVNLDARKLNRGFLVYFERMHLLHLDFHLLYTYSSCSSVL